MEVQATKAIEYVLDGVANGRYVIEDGTLMSNGKEIGWLGRNGYLAVTTPKGKAYIHRIMFAYHHGIDKLHLYETINHIDGDKLNNRIDNLEGLSLAENSKHQWEIGLGKHGEDLEQSTFTADEVNQIRYLAKQGYSQYVIAEHFDTHRSNVEAIVTGANWSRTPYIEPTSVPKLGRVKRKRSDSKLIDRDIEEIREHVVKGLYTRKQLAEKYGVSYSLIRRHTNGL